MLVVTIIGILAALAIPAYQNYVTRAKITEGIQISAPVRTAITDFYQLEGALPASNEELDLPPALQIRGEYTRSVEVLEDGGILITYDDPALSGQTITMTPNPDGGGLIWTCTTTLPASLTPKTCQ